jgi:hypothetical protein
MPSYYCPAVARTDIRVALKEYVTDWSVRFPEDFQSILTLSFPTLNLFHPW